jgi:hypothetical protein
MRKWLIPWAALILAGCQPPPPLVIAMIEAGKLTFHIRHRGLVTDRIFGWDDENEVIERFAIGVGKAVILRFEKGGVTTKPCKLSRTFPVQFAERRCGYRWTGNRTPLRPNMAYDIYLDSCRGVRSVCDDSTQQYWSDWPVGRFQLAGDGSIRNLRPD